MRYLPLLLASLLAAGCAPDPSNLADQEAPGEPGANGKADGFEDNLVDELTEKYGLRPRRYFGFWDRSNEAERRFLDHLPVVTAELNRMAEMGGHDFRFTEAELATNLITEGGFYLLDKDIADSDYDFDTGEGPLIDGFTYLGIDTFVDSIESVDYWIPTELYVYITNAVNNGLAIAFEVENELGQTVTTIFVDTIEQGFEANAAMFAWMRELAVADFAELGHDWNALEPEGQFWWTTVYFNAGPGFGREQLAAEGPDHWTDTWTSGDKPEIHSRYYRYNAGWRTASFELLNKVKYQ